MRTNLADRWAFEVVLYGGIPTYRIHVFQHLKSMGVTGPALLLWGDAPAVDAEPEQAWDGHDLVMGC